MNNNRKIILSESLSFCFGVQRAVEMAESLIVCAGKKRVFSYGPLIHNKTALKRLETGGISIIDNDEAFNANFDGAFVIIRAHGVPPLVEKLLTERGAFIKDATCPKVKANQLLAKKLEDSAYTIFLAGDKEHAEIKGILGYAPGCICVKNEDEANCAASSVSNSKTVLIGQTTFSLSLFDAIAAELKKYFPKIEVKNTICPATSERQNALRRLCEKTDLLVIAGDKTSANTASLAALAEKTGVSAIIVENAGELPRLPENARVIGLAAGASTPPDVIDEIASALKSGTE